MSIHPTAHVEPGAKLGAGVSVGPFSIVHANVEIGDGTTIGSHCEIGVSTPLAGGRPLVIGAGSLIRSHTVAYEGSTYGERLVTGHRVTLRENAVVGRNAQFGTLSDIQGDCRIGDFFRAHSNVHISKLSDIGDFVWIFPYVVLTNDPHPPSTVLKGCTVEDYAVIATMSVVLPGVRIGAHALVGAHSLVNRDVPPSTLVAGNPAKQIRSTHEIMMQDGTGRPAYPWPTQFRQGYPEDAFAGWDADAAPA
jgi:acyl-[acyl carrier protein]--UDP-N-acetylglucosamine O-acyltransferase